MTNPIDTFDPDLMRENLEVLAENPYPGNGIVLGLSSNGYQAIQAYWIMGQDEDSRSQILFDNEEDEVIALDTIKDFRQTSYQQVMVGTDHTDPIHVISNGYQTEAIVDRLEDESEYMGYDSFVDSLLLVDFDPDSPNYTPSIFAMTHVSTIFNGISRSSYGYSIIRRNPTTGRPEHTFGYGLLNEIPAGAGICFHTYASEGSPLPSFTGSPYPIEVCDDIEATADMLWLNLDEENRVALAVKSIDRKTGEIAIKIINQLG